MINIFEEINNRSAYYLPVTEIDTVYENFSGEDETAVLIMPERYFRNAYIKKPEIIKNYYISGIFDLGEVYSPYVDLRFSLYLLTKTKNELLKTSVYRESLYIKEKPKGRRLIPGVADLDMPDNYPDEYWIYLEEIEKWINNGVVPHNSFFANYNQINSTAFSFEEPFSLRYSAQSMEIRNKLNQEALEPLSNFAEIIEPSYDDITDKAVLTVWNHCEFEYPLDDSYFKKGRVYNCLLQKGDILLGSWGNDYQINFILDELAEDVYCPANTIIVRAKKGVSPEYIFLYLRSETGKIIFGDKYHGSVIKYLSLEEIRKIPLIVPKRPNRQYRKLFEEIFMPQSSLDVFSDCFKHQSIDTLEGVFNIELVSKSLICRNKLAKKIIMSDLQEVRTCFEAGAYKATLIMAGSVLEAFLIDWLTELENTDYFNDEKEISLNDLIWRIKDIKKPRWMSAADKAHSIRKKRNLVHAKLCLKEEAKIDKNLCAQVIDYLQSIINTRYMKSK